MRTIVSGLAQGFPGAVLIVLHTGSESILPSLLAAAGPLPAAHAQDREEIQPGRIYVAPADRHMLVIDGHLELSHGPRENYVRPAIDPLMRTAAEYYGPDAIGVVLTGRLNDGTAGLFEIKRRGGTAIVQDPHSAEAPGMPQSALDNVAVDFALPVADIAPLITRLCADKRRVEPLDRGVIAMKEEKPLRRPTAQTCPECGGAMAEEVLGTLTRFRCHIGHIMTAEVLAATQLDALEGDLAAVLRFLNERVDLCRRMAERHRANGNTAAAELWQKAADESAKREAAARAFTDAEWIHPEEAAAAR